MNLINFAKDLDKEFRKDCAKSQTETPWFGHFTIDADENTLSYKVGDAARIDLRIIDWRHPLAKAYFSLAPGDPFDLDDYQENLSATDRYASISGDILRRTSIVGRNAVIYRATIMTEDGESIVEFDGGGYRILDALTARFRSIEGLPDIRSLLTKEQYDLITTSTLKPLIIQGQAGSGKTTAALYRVSWLMHPENRHAPIDPKNVLIVMFNKALQSFVSTTLDPLGMADANVYTFHAWALKEVKQAYNGDIKISTDRFDGADVARNLKKQIGLLKALDEFVEKQADRLYQWVEQKLRPYGDMRWQDLLTQGDQPIVQRLIRLRTKALSERDIAVGVKKERITQIHLLFGQAVKRMTLYKEELLNFLTDKELLKKHLPHVSDADLQALASYQKSLQNKDGSSRRPGPFISFEDLALILRLIQIKHGGLADKNEDDHVNLYDHLVVDEAQDFGAVEMTVLLSAVRTRSGVTIVGDANQKIIPEADFIGWDKLTEQLGIEGAEVAKLKVAHRSTRQIMELACSIIADAPSDGRPGPKPGLFIIDSEDSKLQRIAFMVNQLLNEAPACHICIVCRHRREAAPLLEKLQQEPVSAPIRLGHNKNFEFSPGVTVTNLRQIKGLEFDGVILLDPTEANYPADDQGRKYLYTVITRAKDYLYMIGDDAPCSLLKPAINNKIIDFENQLEVVPIEFTEEDDEPF